MPPKNTTMNASITASIVRHPAAFDVDVHEILATRYALTIAIPNAAMSHHLMPANGPMTLTLSNTHRMAQILT